MKKMLGVAAAALLAATILGGGTASAGAEAPAGPSLEAAATSTRSASTQTLVADRSIQFTPMPASEAGPAPKAATKAVADGQWTYGLMGINSTATALTGWFNRDSRSDTIWYAPVGGSYTSVVWLWSPSAFRYVPLRFNAPPQMKPILGDFDGDKYTDIFWYCPGACQDVLSIADGSAVGFRNFALRVDASNYVVNTVVPGSSHVTSTPGGYAFTDYAGKDEVWFYPSDGVKPLSLSFNLGAGKYTEWTWDNLPARRAPIVGNFIGTKPYEDILLYNPSGRDTLIGQDEEGRAKVYELDLTVSATSSPATIRRSAPKFWAAGGSSRPLDSILFYDQATCGKASQIARINTTTYQLAPVPKPAAVAGDDSQCKHDDVVKTFEGTPTVIIHRTHGGRRVKALDQQVVDKPGSPVVNRRLTPTTAQDLDQPIRIHPGDYNGDHKMDILWYGTGPKIDLLWYGRK